MPAPATDSRVAATVATQIQPPSQCSPTQVRATQTTAPAAPPMAGSSRPPSSPRFGRTRRPMRPAIRPIRMMKSSSTSGDEADAARLLAPDLDVGERGHGNDVEPTALVGERQMGRLLLDRVRHLLLHVRGRLGALEAELAR